MKAGDLNAMIDDLNEALWSSLASTERSAYGEVSFFETDFMLDELAQFLRLLKAGGDIQDRPLTAVDSMRPFLEQGLGRTSGARSIVDVGMLSTTQIIRDLNITKKEASKIRRDLLFAALTALDAKTIKSDVARVNPIVERFHTRFPRDRLHALARSGRGVVVKPSTPKKGKAGRPDQKRRKDRNK
jgi:hypothetical protein